MVVNKTKGLNGLEKKMIKEYLINANTFYIKPVTFDNKPYSIIVELDQEFLCPQKPLKIVSNSCAFFGVNFKDRRRGSRLLIDYQRKLPIVIEPINKIYAFPTLSPNHVNNIWFFSSNIRNCQPGSRGETLVSFSNNQTVCFPISHSIFSKQLSKTWELQTKLMQRVAESGKKQHYWLEGPKTSTATKETKEANETNETKVSKASKASEDNEVYLNDKKE